MVDDPAAGGSLDPAKKDGGDGGADGVLTREAVQGMITEGFKAGRESMMTDVNTAITGATKRQVKELTESEDFGKAIGGHVAEAVKAAAAPPPDEPTKVQSLEESLVATQGVLNEEIQKRKVADAKASEGERITAIGDMLKGQNIDPNHAVNFRTLVANGHLDGLNATPRLVDGQLVYASADGLTKPASEIMSDYLKTNSHWLSRFTAAGGGAPGSNPNAAPLSSDYAVDPSSQGQKATIDALKTNPEAATKAIEAHVASKAKGIPGWQ